MDGWMDGWTGGWTCGGTDGWMDGRMGGWMDGSDKVKVFRRNFFARLQLDTSSFLLFRYAKKFLLNNVII